MQVDWAKAHSSSENSVGAGSSYSSLQSISSADLECFSNPSSVVSEKWELAATDKLGCADVLMLYDDWPGKLRFWVQGQGEARRELNKLNQLFGSGKISKAKQETKSDNTKPGKQYLHFQEI